MLRRLGLDDSGPLSALLLLGAMTAAFAGGMVLKGKSGWCSTICPLLPVQRIYGQTPLALVANAHCQPCVGCVKNCYDFNPRAAYLADLHDADNYWSGYRRFFVGAFPGLVLGFFAGPGRAVARGPRRDGALRRGQHRELRAAEHVREDARRTRSRRSTARSRSASSTGSPATSARSALTWAIRAAAIALAATWFVRTLRKEKPFLERATATPARRAVVRAGGALGRGQPASPAAPRSRSSRRTSTSCPKPGQSLLEIAEANGLPIEAGCRMGICGADPVAIKERDGLHVADLRRRAGDARAARAAPRTRGWRAACASPGRSRSRSRPTRPRRRPSAASPGFNYDRDVKRVVVIGNGIAGVTAADHLRRRHPECAIDLIADEPHHLYNRMGISRLVYGRSAMQGLYLNPDGWYDDRGITTWLNTRALWIDRGKRRGRARHRRASCPTTA